MKTDNKSLCKESTFKEVYNTYAQDLHDYLYYKYGSEYNPDDVVQESFIKLWKHCGNVTIQKVKSYLFTLVNNATLNIIKHKKVVLKYQKQEISNTTIESPEFLLEQQQFMERYERALANLSAEQRIAFLLNKAEGKKHQEIADQLGVTRRVVEYRIYSAYDQLKNELENFYLK